MNEVAKGPGPSSDSAVDPARIGTSAPVAPSPQGEGEETLEQDAELAADLEEIWQEESPDTARRTEFAEQVDGDPDTREVAQEG